MYRTYTQVFPELPVVSEETARYLEVESQYRQYIDRQRKEIAAFKEQEHLPIPENLDYNTLDTLSNEERQKLSELRPSTLGAAKRISGIRPVGLMVLYSLSRAHAKATMESSR